MTTLSHKNDRIELRIEAAKKKLLAYAASLRNMNVTGFMLDSAFKEAERIITERANFALSPKQWKKFCEILDRPAREIPRLKKLFSKKTLFDE